MTASVASAAETIDEAPTGISSDESTALYEGRLINLAEGWEGAGACLVWPEVLTVSECFGTEAELEERVAELSGPTLSSVELSPELLSGPVVMAATTCSSFLKLYDGTYYTGASLWMSVRWSWSNLSNYGFDQRTSSFKIGACSAYFADYSNGGGAWYPTGSTQAYDVASTMASGWNNDVSSVYIT